jgi:hypothetical protein
VTIAVRKPTLVHCRLQSGGLVVVVATGFVVEAVGGGAVVEPMGEHQPSFTKKT